MNVYRWNTDIGEVLACADDVAAARRQVMGTLSTDDAARLDLEQAIAEEPELVEPPAALVAWHH
jgi:hypothetical protein